MPWLWGKQNPLRFQFVSHKLLRLLAPLALAVALVTACFLHGPVYRIALGLQVVFYALALLAMTRLMRGPMARLADPAFTFVVLNSAAVVAFANFVTRRRAVWIR